MSSSLRRRVGFGFAALGALVAFAVSVSAYQFTLALESRLVAQTLDAELVDYIARRSRDVNALPPSSQALRTWVISDRVSPGDAPPWLRTLDVGLHRRNIDGRGWFIEVRDEGASRFAVMLDDASIRVREAQLREFLLGAGLLAAILGGAIGWWLAGRIIAPVRQLAERVSALHPEQPMAPLPANSKDDEIAWLQRAFLDYQARLAEFVRREQAFTADASHELRTPVAVVMGAVDVLRANPDLTPAQARAVERIGRAGVDMEHLIAALLRLAREDPEHTSGAALCRLDVIINGVVDHLAHVYVNKPVRVVVEAEAVEVKADCRLLEVVIENLLRNALTYTEEGEVRVVADADGVCVQDTGPGIPEADRDRVFERYFQGRTGGGAGIGLELATRVAERHGWRVELHEPAAQGARIRLNLNPVSESNTA